MKTIDSKSLRAKRKRRIRAKVSGTSTRPRLTVFKSLTGIYAQLIDDSNGVTLVSASLKEIKNGKNTVSGAMEVGKIIAKKAADKKIKEAVFDRGGYNYHGKVKALAEGAREGGLVF